MDGCAGLDDSLNESFTDTEATPAEVMAVADRKILLMISQKGESDSHGTEPSSPLCGYDVTN